MTVKERVTFENKVRQLILESQQGNLESRNKVVEMNLGIAEKIASKYISLNEYEDILQIAYMALTKCIDRFDLNSGSKFSTFAYHSVNGEVKNYFRENSLVRVRRQSHLVHKKIKSYESNFYMLYGYKPSYEETSEELGIDIEEIKRVKLEMQQVYSLSGKSNNSENSDDQPTELIDTIEMDFADDYTNNIVIQETLKKVLNDKELLIMNYKLQKFNAKEISRETGIPVLKVRSEWRKIMEKVSNFFLTYRF